VFCLLACGFGLGLVVALIFFARRRRPDPRPQVRAAAPPPPAPAEAPAEPVAEPVAAAIAPDAQRVDELTARLQAEMSVSAEIATERLAAPSSMTPTAMLERAPESRALRPATVTTVFTVETEPAPRLDELVATPSVVQAPPEPTNSRRMAAWLLGAVAAVGLALCLALLIAGERAADTPDRYPMPNVVGMPRDQAQAALARSDVRITTVRADYGPPGVVLSESGFDADGTYGPGSRIVLLVGGGSSGSG
jgi:hypothetical protein